MLKLRINSESLELNAAKGKNLYPFTATITYFGRPSDKFVGGTDLVDDKGPYRVVIPNELGNSKIKDLEGKGVFAAEDLDEHANSICVGEFVSTWTEKVGDTTLAKASGLIKRNNENSDLVDRIIEEARANKLGFSYDIKSVAFVYTDLEASNGSQSERVLTLTDFQWRGATILKRQAAAYEETLLAANKIQTQEDEDMDAKEIQTLLTAALTPLVEQVGSLKTEMAELKAKQEKAATPTPTPTPAPVPATPVADGTKVSLKDLAAQIALGVSEAIKEQLKPIQDLVASSNAPTKGTRHSFSAHEIQFYGKYTDKKENDQMDVADYQAIIDSVKYDDHLSRDRKVAMLEAASSIKRELARKQILSGGGAQ